MTTPDVFKYVKLPPEQRLSFVLILCFSLFIFVMNEDRKRHFQDDERARVQGNLENKELRDENKLLRDQNWKVTTDFIKFVVKSKTDIDTLENKIEKLSE